VTGRLDRLRALLELPLIVTHPANVYYLTGLASSNAVALVEPDRLRLFTDFRYLEQARALEDAEVVELPRSLFSELPRHLPVEVGFEAEHLAFAAWEALRDGGVQPVPQREVVERVRAVKEAAELDAIRGAAEITTRMLERLAEQRFVGQTEKELAWWIESQLHELGGDGPAFEPIVAAGANGALPHADPGDAVIGRGTTVVVDAAARLGRYCSDCTRTFATGPLPDELARSYEVCLAAQEQALAAVAAGASGPEVDAVARAAIAAEGLGELFGHGLGHGVGLEVHELPRLRPESRDVLAACGVVTVEPGIYHPGLGGVRIEDLVVVREDGPPEVLTTFPKQLVTVS